MQGIGLYTWVDGCKYDGAWEDNQKHGYGIYTWPDGRKYDGQF